MIEHIFTNKIKRLIAFFYDLTAIAVAFLGALYLRFDFVPPPEIMAVVVDKMPIVFVVQGATLIAHRLYRGIWSFASVRDLFAIIRAVTVSVLASLAVIVAISDRLTGWPRSIFVIDAFLLLVALGGGRFGYRYFKEVVYRSNAKKKRILIIGAGESANLIAREIHSHPELGAKVVGFLDDRQSRIGMQLQGATVLGNIDSLAESIKRSGATEVIIGIPSLPGAKVKQIVQVTRELGLPSRICPPVRQALSGSFQLTSLREIRVEDLLRRDVVNVDHDQLKHLITGKTVLVTGAGGSIGSELCRQILLYEPKSLVLYERSEFALYSIEKEFATDSRISALSTKIECIIGDVLDRSRFASVLKKFKPHFVLHAAAYKHVPIMEANVIESVKNNVIGTMNVVEESAIAGVEKFVLISTDKAVRPTSVMGATKRVAEVVTNTIGTKKGMNAMAVRFGNVLDSQGSVLPLFKEQIAKGGPVTVTHRDMKRYFMTIPEAALLVLQAACYGNGGEVFLLDMGQPVPIRELAEEVILLAGYQPYRDIDIVFTGLRPGEKLYEELLTDLQSAEPTQHPKIVVSAREMDGVLPQAWRENLSKMTGNDTPATDTELKDWLKKWVPDFCTPDKVAPDSSETVGETLYASQ